MWRKIRYGIQNNHLTGTWNNAKLTLRRKDKHIGKSCEDSF